MKQKKPFRRSARVALTKAQIAKKLVLTEKKLDEAELTVGDAPHLFQLLDRVMKSIERIDKENPTGPDEETDPRIVAFLKIAQKITDRLDPLVRENYKDNPVRLAEWDEIMHMCDDIKEEKLD